MGLCYYYPIGTMDSTWDSEGKHFVWSTLRCGKIQCGYLRLCFGGGKKFLILFD